MHVKEFVAEIKRLLKARSGKSWSVTYESRGTAYGWVRIAVPPARCVYDVDGVSPWPEELRQRGERGCPGQAEMEELMKLLGLEHINPQGASVPPSTAYQQEYLDRAAGKVPTVYGQPWWD